MRALSPSAQLILSAVLLAAPLSGCQSSRSPAPSPPSVAPGVSATSAEQEALRVYRGMWESFSRAAEVPDPDAADLRGYATDRALARIVSVLVGYRETDVVTRGAPVLDPHVTAVTPTEVTVVDCGDSTNWTKQSRSTGVQVQDDPRGRRTITAVVKRAEGAWKVVSFEVGDIGSC